MIIFPTCKINLGLQVTNKRLDGYHDIQTAMLELPIRDVLELLESEEDSFTTSGLPLLSEGNIILNALALFREKVAVPPLSIHLHKLIPMGAGLGGGSSDAAFTLKFLRDTYAPEMSNAELEELAAALGSDCAFFVSGGLQYATGRGEILSPLSLVLQGKKVVLVNLGIHVSTQEAYASIVPRADRNSVEELLSLPISQWHSELMNDFETGVFALHPQLKQVKELLYQHGALYAAMTGSGSTMFGLFEGDFTSIDWPFPIAFEKVVSL